MQKLLVKTLLLSACTTEKDKETKTANSKVEQLGSRVKELESKYSKDEIKAYLNEEYDNEYTKEFINKAYDEGVLLFHNGKLGIY